jgi:hypothetical protein
MGSPAVYLLETHRFSKKYSRFMRSNPKAFPEFYPYQFSKNWTPPRLAKDWKPAKLIGDVAPDNDYPGEGAPAWLVPVFSPRAVDGLREFLEPNGELLPVITPLGTYYAYNVTTLVDALDIDKCDITGYGRLQINRYAFKPKCVDGSAIFKIPQQPVEIYITDPFVQRVQELELNGMWITKCWPMPPGVRWLDAWEAVLNAHKAEYEAEATKQYLAQASHKAAAAPRILDLRKDVSDIVRLLKRAVAWIEKNQPAWEAKMERASAIELETSGWDMDSGPDISCHVDTREVHETDGEWSHYGVVSMERPRWTALLRSLEEEAAKHILIDIRGKTHRLETDDDRIIRWCCEAMVAAIKQAKSDGLFKRLRNPKACELSAQDIDSGFFWPEAGKRIVHAG